ncbi:HAMP domain-containing protein, partial [Vibrio parahaemolyticus]|nr:HAMP domain-containing protein [Vibrio parahaemolyticus]
GYVIGSMRVTLSHRPIVEAIQSSLQDGALLLLFLIAGGTVFYISIERLVLKPVMELNRVIENVTHGRNTENQARYYAKDEIGDLASSFNQMMNRLTVREKQRQHSLDTLEQKRAFSEEVIESVQHALVITDN